MTTGKIARGTTAYRRISISMLLAGLATFATFYCVQPLLPLFSQRFGVNAEEASLVVSITIGPMAIALLGTGMLSDRIGRRPLMIASLFLAALFTLLCAAAEGWKMLLAMRLLVGVSLAGVPAVAMAYIVEEIEDGSVGHAMGLYIGGTAIGGMSGRLLGGFIADLAGWRIALAAVGAFMLLTALAFWRSTPHSAHFTPRQVSIPAYFTGIRRLFRDRAIPLLFAEAFLLMGAFVSIYNYASYRLVAPPYNLSPALVSTIFVLYILGSASSAIAGNLAARIGARRMVWALLLFVLAGIGLTTLAPLPLVILGIAVITVGFFGAHSIASAWVGRRARADRAQASSLYLFFYYMGGSVLGSAGGFAWTHGQWPGVAGFTAALIALGAFVGMRLAYVKPLSAKSDG